MAQDILFDPLVPWPLIGALTAVVVALCAFALWRRMAGWFLRGLAGAVLLVALANPALHSEDREPLQDIVLVVADRTASQRLSDRADQTTEAVETLRAEIDDLGMEMRLAEVPDAQANRGSLAMTELSEMMAETPRARVAGAVIVTDGRIHDAEMVPDMPAPLHALLTGRPEDWDRRLIVRNAPAFAILGEEVTLTVRIEDEGAAPTRGQIAPRTDILIAVDGGPPQRFEVPIGEDMDLPLTLPHAGRNVLQFEVPTAEGELTDRNNSAVVQMNGVRDRLRVLLVSGQPHPGQRTWRNLLKSDPSVDLVHFTILRPPDRQDGVPVTELSLIAFPTRELFTEAIDEFDLIIFDRYPRRGILPMMYLDNVRRYVEEGGALLLAAGPEYAGANSLYRSPLSRILPGDPTARVIETPYLPRITEMGARHPVTRGLTGAAPRPDDAEAPWGGWFRLVELDPDRGQVVMQGAEDAPLLLLDRVAEGRVAVLASDHAWLWNRGYEGGGPQLEMLRRLAHWMMGEPDLEEEALQAEAVGQTITITRQTLDAETGPVVVIAPDGTETEIALQEVAPGRFQATHEGADMGLYRLRSGDLDTVIALGPAAPREFERTIAGGEAVLPAIEADRGGIVTLSEGLPDLRSVAEGRNAAGRGWIGVTPRGAYLTADITVTPLVSGWIFLLLAAGLIIAAWLREGRR